jgi:hypothetical protein
MLLQVSWLQALYGFEEFPCWPYLSRSTSSERAISCVTLAGASGTSQSEEAAIRLGSCRKHVAGNISSTAEQHRYKIFGLG